MRHLNVAIAALALATLASPAIAADAWRHALSLVGTPKFGPDFKHFDWVNPDAPKGGSVTMSEVGTYDTMNFLPAGANPPAGIGLVYETLMDDSLDEPSTQYGLIAESASYPEDRSSVTYRLRKEARFNDGTPITPEDVIWSFEKAKEINPFSTEYYKNVAKVEQTGDRDVTFHFSVKGNRELPFIVGQTTVFPKHWWMGKDAAGKPRDISKGLLEAPVGSGPYRIKSFEAGRNIVYERVPDHWSKDLPNMVGLWNFGTIRYEFYNDPTVAFEAFKTGDSEFRVENSSKKWATEYSFKAVAAKAVKTETYPLRVPQGMQGFVFNLRKARFTDPRVREAIGLAFDFEWSNKNLFYGQYTRSPSYFTNSEYAASGLPQGRELELLNEVKDLVPPKVFTDEFKNPVNNTSDDLREHIRKALQLLKEAGWDIKSGTLVNAKTGEPMTIEMLEADNTFDRILTPYFQNLKHLGINATIRVVDDSQFVKRLRSFDFDMITQTIAQSESPGNEQRDFWGSAAADLPGSRNYMGLKNPAIDKLVDHIILATDHAELVAACKALDRVLLWNFYVVPQWHQPAARLAYWDKFRRPEKGPSRTHGFPSVWWYDKDAAAKVDAVKGK